MRHRKKTVILGREKGPRTALLRNLATSVVLFERVQTTRAKAKAVQPLVERLVTVAKNKNASARRELNKILTTRGAVLKVTGELAPRYEKRAGGYTRITRLGFRKGDAAEIVQLEFV
ncbi:50S ribosomal protein L17 [Patescibacteria group bacterium]|nr:MAG: 50S ribosomal protein L17 [Patescibacteria group bacterium]